MDDRRGGRGFRGRGRGRGRGRFYDYGRGRGRDSFSSLSPSNLNDRSPFKNNPVHSERFEPSPAAVRKIEAVESEDQSGYESGEIMPVPQRPVAVRRGSTQSRDGSAGSGSGRFGGRGRGRGGRFGRGRGGRYPGRGSDNFSAGRYEEPPKRFIEPPREVAIRTEPPPFIRDDDRGRDRGPPPPREPGGRFHGDIPGLDDRYGKRPRDDLSYHGDYEDKRPRSHDYGTRGRSPMDDDRPPFPLKQPPPDWHRGQPDDMRRIENRRPLERMGSFDGPPPRREEPIGGPPPPPFRSDRDRFGPDDGPPRSYNDVRARPGPRDRYVPDDRSNSDSRGRPGKFMEEPVPPTFHDDSRGLPPPPPRDEPRSRFQRNADEVSTRFGDRELSRSYGDDGSAGGGFRDNRRDTPIGFRPDGSGSFRDPRDAPGGFHDDSSRGFRDNRRDGPSGFRDGSSSSGGFRDRARDGPGRLHDKPRDRAVGYRDEGAPVGYRNIPPRDAPPVVFREDGPPGFYDKQGDRPLSFRDSGPPGGFRDPPRDAPMAFRDDGPGRFHDHSRDRPMGSREDGPGGYRDRPRPGFHDLPRERPTNFHEDTSIGIHRDKPTRDGPMGFRDDGRGETRDRPMGFRDDGPPRRLSNFDLPPEPLRREFSDRRPPADLVNGPRDVVPPRESPRDAPRDPVRDDGGHFGRGPPPRPNHLPADAARERSYISHENFRNGPGRPPPMESEGRTPSWTAPSRPRDPIVERPSRPKDSAPPFRDEYRPSGVSNPAVSRPPPPFEGRGSFPERGMGRGRGGRGFGVLGRGRGGRADFGRFGGRGPSSSFLRNVQDDASNTGSTSGQGTWNARPSGGIGTDPNQHQRRGSQDGVSGAERESSLPREEAKPVSSTETQGFTTEIKQPGVAAITVEEKPKETTLRPLTPPPAGKPSGVVMALARLADLESQMEYAYAKHMQLVKRQKELQLQSRILENLPVGLEAIQEELDALMKHATNSELAQ